MQMLGFDTTEFGRKAFRMVIVLMLLQWHHTSWKCLFWALYIRFEMQYRQKKRGTRKGKNKIRNKWKKAKL